MKRHRHGTSVRFALITALLLAGAGWAKDIVPQEGPDITVRRTPEGAVADAKVGPIDLAVRLSTSQGVVYIDVDFANGSDEPLAITPDCVRLEAAGDTVDALDPDAYVALRFDTKPYTDAEDDTSRGRRTGLVSGTNGPGRQQPNLALPDPPKKTLFHGDKYPTLHEMRTKVTDVLHAMRKDLLVCGGAIPPGERARGRKAYQRNGLELPLTVMIKPPGFTEPVAVTFARAR